MVFQDHKLLLRSPGVRQRGPATDHRRRSAREIDKRVRAALDQVGLLGEEKTVPLELRPASSSASASRARSSAKPALLIADEPTGNLDPQLALEVMTLFRRFNEVGVTVVVATHDVHLIEQFRARRIVLGDGRITAP